MKFIRYGDILVLLAIVSLSLLPLFLKNTTGEKSFILFVDDQKIPLKKLDRLIDLKKYGKNVLIEVTENGMRFVESDCGDKICIKTGFLDDCGESAVCVPNKVAIQIECKEKEFDAISR